jgi:hypothetical protein
LKPLAEAIENSTADIDRVGTIAQINFYSLHPTVFF